LKEKTLHTIIKHYIEEDTTKHEIKVNSFIADIKYENKIVEIQTQAFDKLRNKLNNFLTTYKVTIVYPIPYIKWLYWIDKDKSSKKRKSNKIGNIYDITYELYKIKYILPNPNLSILILFINMDEYKYLNGWNKDKKKGASKYDLIPLELVDEIQINDINDYSKFIPISLPKQFTSNDFKQLTKTRIHTTRVLLNILYHIKLIKRVSKIRNSYVYEINN